MNLRDLAIELSEKVVDGLSFETLLIDGEQEVLQVAVEDIEELPVFVTVTDEQILCISYLFEQNEVKSESIAEMNEMMLRVNVPMPLSAFALIDNRYALFGSLASTSSFEEVAHEIAVLATNAADALESIEEFLN